MAFSTQNDIDIERQIEIMIIEAIYKCTTGNSRSVSRSVQEHCRQVLCLLKKEGLPSPNNLKFEVIDDELEFEMSWKLNNHYGNILIVVKILPNFFCITTWADRLSVMQSHSYLHLDNDYMASQIISLWKYITDAS